MSVLAPRIKYGGYSREQSAPGHGYAASLRDGVLLATVVDGLGTGPLCEQAVRTCLQVVEAEPDARLSTLMLRCHDALGTTFGAAVGLLRVNPSGYGSFAAVGNILLVGQGRQPELYYGRPGVVGHMIENFTPETFYMAPGYLYCLATGGISTELDLTAMRGVNAEEAARSVVARWSTAGNDAAAVVFGYDSLAA